MRGTPQHRIVGWLLPWSEIEHERCCFLSLFLVCAPSIYLYGRALARSLFPSVALRLVHSGDAPTT